MLNQCSINGLAHLNSDCRARSGQLIFGLGPLKRHCQVPQAYKAHHHHLFRQSQNTHSGAETAALVACETENQFQIGSACLQVISWSCFAVLVGLLSTRYGVGRQHLRSSSVYTCVVPRTQSPIGDRSFFVAGPRLWNNLPTETRRRGTTFEYYRRLLKAFFVRLRCGTL